MAKVISIAEFLARVGEPGTRDMTAEAEARKERARKMREAEEARIAALNHFVGSKYEETKGLDIAEVAKLVRKDIKAAIKEGHLPKVKTSVRISRFSGGCSLDITVKSRPEGMDVSNRGRVMAEMDNPHDNNVRINLLSIEATRVLDTLKSILNAYNFDHSDRMTDYWHVRFYDNVDFDWDVREADTARIKAEIAAERERWDALPVEVREECLAEVRAMYAEVDRRLDPRETLAIAMNNLDAMLPAMLPEEPVEEEADEEPEPEPEPAASDHNDWLDYLGVTS